MTEMTNLGVPRNDIKIRANIFYRLLWEAVKNKISKSSNGKGEHGKNTEAQLFYDLNNLIDKGADQENYSFLRQSGNIVGAAKNYASQFKHGKIKVKNSASYKLNNTNIVRQFDYQMKHSYSEMFKRMIVFSRTYFDCSLSASNTDLIQKVLFLILNDASISDSQEFYICSDGSTKTKADLGNMETIEFEAFLLGIWHFLIFSQRLQPDLEDKNEIIVDPDYQMQNISLTYSDKEIARTTVPESETNPPADTGEECEETEECVEQPEKQPNAKWRTIIMAPEKARRIKEAAAGHHIASEFETPADPIRDFNIISALANNDIRLSRGIFFYLLTNSIQAVHPKRDKNAAERLFLDLARLTSDQDCVLKPDRGLTRYYPDKFRQLKMRCSPHCLDDESQINAFSKKILNDYVAVLSDMIKIRKKYFNSEEKNENLVVALIEFIRNDDSIDNRQEFLVCSDGTVLTKAQLCEAEGIEFEPFLLGIWHYAVAQYSAEDSFFEYTFDVLFRINKNTPPDEELSIHRPPDLIAEQSEMYVELIYIDE